MKFSILTLCATLVIAGGPLVSARAAEITQVFPVFEESANAYSLRQAEEFNPADGLLNSVAVSLVGDATYYSASDFRVPRIFSASIHYYKYGIDGGIIGGAEQTFVLGGYYSAPIVFSIYGTDTNATDLNAITGISHTLIGLEFSSIYPSDTVWAAPTGVSMTLTYNYTPEPNLVANGDFEAGNLTGWAEKSYPATTVVASSVGNDVSTDEKFKVSAFDGNSFARLVGVGCKNCLDPVANGNLSQLFTGITNGEKLTLVYYENDRDSGKSAPLVLKFGTPGDLLRYDPTAIGVPSAGGWQEYEATFTSAGDEDLLSFQFQTAPGYFYGLDDVSLIDPPSSVPEPAVWALMLVGASGVGATIRGRRRSGLVGRAA